MNRRKQRNQGQPQQVISENGTGNIGGTHFHGDFTVYTADTRDPDRYLSGYADLIRRQEDRVARHQVDALTRPTYVKSSLISAWEQWNGSPDWYQLVVDRASQLCSALDPAWAPSLVIKSWRDEATATRRSYPFVQQGLLRLDLKAAQSHLHHRLDSPESAASRDRYAAGLQGCKWLQEQAERPTFSNAFNIAGQFGSGRSRMLTHIAALASAEGSLAFLLSPHGEEGIGAAIHRYVAEGTGIAVGRFTDLARFLERRPAPQKITILLDDLDLWARAQPAVVKELQWLIDESSQSEQIRWVCTADSNGLDAVTSSEPFFWVRHGYVPGAEDEAGVPASDRTTGWLDLDAANSFQRTGLQIMESRLSSEAEDINAVHADLDTFAHELAHLTSPLAAWIRLESHDRRQPLTDVNSVPFVRAYWAWVKERITDRDANRQDRLEAALRALARAQVHQPGGHLNITARFSDEHETALADLKSGSLIRITSIGDDEVDERTLRIDPLFPALWGMRTARIALADNPDRAQDAKSFALWWSKAEQGLGVAEATCQFALTQCAPNDEDQAEQQFWRTWTAHPDSPKAPLLMAATTCGGETEALAIGYIAIARYRPKSKRELFVLMRFVARASSVDWRADDRLAALRPHVAEILRNGLEAYLHMTLTTLLESADLVTEANYLRVCLALDGYEGAGVRAVAAELVVNAGRKIFADDETAWVHTILRYCKKQGPGDRNRGQGGTFSGKRRNSPTSRGKHQPPQATHSSTFDVKSSFAAALTSAVSADVIATSGSDGCRMLARMDWWTAADIRVHRGLADYMRQKLTTEFGSTIHKGSAAQNKVDEYEAVVRDLLSGRLIGRNPEADAIAYYLLKHSVPTYGRADVKIHEKLRPMLRSIARNPRLGRRLGSELQELLQANGLDGRR